MSQPKPDPATVQIVLDWLIGDEPPKSMGALVGQLMNLRDFGTRWDPSEVLADRVNEVFNWGPNDMFPSSNKKVEDEEVRDH